LAVAGVVVSAVVLTSVPAEAATGYDRCPANRMCVFTGLNGAGAIGIFASGDADLSDSSGPQGLNNNIESAWNRRGLYLGLYEDAGYVGNRNQYVLPNSRQNLSWRNIASSLRETN
jgi:hypothetical protein